MLIAALACMGDLYEFGDGKFIGFDEQRERLTGLEDVLVECPEISHGGDRVLVTYSKFSAVDIQHFLHQIDSFVVAALPRYIASRDYHCRCDIWVPFFVRFFGESQCLSVCWFRLFEMPCIAVTSAIRIKT